MNATAEPMIATRPRLLVVDDDASVLELTSEVLEGCAVVDRCHNGADALELLWDGIYDALVLDIHMPVVSGGDIHAWLWRYRPDLVGRVVFITGDALSKQARDLAWQSGAPIVQKPYRIDQLLAALVTTLEHAQADEATPEA